MFKAARIKLTLYYLAIIMVINIFFSLIIYHGATTELRRIESLQHLRRPTPFNIAIEPEIIEETKQRIAYSLISLNILILGIAGVGSYFLAGKTLAPIKKNLDDQKDFVSNASHELRTPLTSMKSEIEVGLRDKRMTLTTAKDLLKSNLDDVNNMTRLANYLLKLNKFENRNARDNHLLQEYDFKKLDLAEIIKRAVGKQKVELNLEKTIIDGDKDSLKELVSILIDNAVKYSPKEKNINVSLKNKTLKVSDHGIGISEEDLPHIFDRFFRGDKARNHNGYGLGLSIAKQIVDLHSAKISVDSKSGSGSVFKVIFS